MPRRQPFTALCRQAAALARPDVVDLHVHTSASDGDYTASQIVAFAAQARLKAVAITDHDTTAGVALARAACRENGYGIEIVPGVEITTHQGNRDYHLLAYFTEEDAAFQGMLEHLQSCRRTRFQTYLDRLAGQGRAIPTPAVDAVRARSPSLGRRHLADLLMATGHVRSRHDAFRRFLIPLAAHVPKLREVAISEVIARVHAAGGVTSLAHPSAEMTFDELVQLRDLGLDAVEVAFPAATYTRTLELRRWAGELGLGSSGGSDCHGPDSRVGSRTVSIDDLSRLRRSAGLTRCTSRADGTLSARVRG
jgi:hypothetical protein